MQELTKFGINVKFALVEQNQNQKWLINEVKNETGKFFDGSYLFKLMTGKYENKQMINAICKILKVEYPS